MQRLFQQLDERLRTFVRQRESLLLLVTCRDEDTAFLLKTLQSLDESSADIFWMFIEDFVDPHSYAEAIAKTFRARVEALNQKFVEVGKAAWPALPPRLLDPRTPPFARLQILLLYARKRITNLEVSRLVVAFTPGRIEHPLRWRNLLREFVEYDPSSPWCHHMRVIARERTGVVFPEVSGEIRERTSLDNFKSTETYTLDLSPDALRAAVKDDIADKGLPIADRAQALLTDAMIDYAHQRYKPALMKYRLLRDFFGHVGHEPMLALVLNGMGEVFARTGLRDQAVEHFERAITPSVNSKSHPVLLNVTLNLANLYLAEELWEKASQHYAGADVLATALLNAHVKLAVLENLGVCRLKLRDYRGAQTAWRDGATLARALDEKEARRRLLLRLRDLYVEAHMREDARVVEDELRGIS